MKGVMNMTAKEKKLADLLGQVLGCCELNLDEMEDSTRKLVQEASIYLANEIENKPLIYGSVGWQIGDVQSLCKLDDKAAEEWLNKNEKYLQDAMTEKGWGILEGLLDYDGIEIKRADDCDDDEELPG